MARTFFILSCCVFAFLVGIGTALFQVFPFQFLNQAKVGLESWAAILLDTDSSVFLRQDPEDAAGPRTVSSDLSNTDDSLILVTGGPYALMSECPQFGCLAWITDREGTVLHSWEADLGEVWADTPDHIGLKDHKRFNPLGLHLSDQGDLTVSFQSDSLSPYGVGIARFDRDSNLIWKKANFSHHWFSVGSDDRIYTPAATYVDSPLRLGDTGQTLVCEKGSVQSDVVLVLDPNGETLAEISIIDLLVQGDFVGLLARTSDPCDPIHLNYVEYVSSSAVDNDTLTAGDLIISARHLNLVAAIDVARAEIKWTSTGRTVQQHSPRVMPDGSILVFDNFGGPRTRGGSRLARLVPGQDTLEVVFPRQDTPRETNFWSLHQGHIDPHPDGIHALISLSHEGRILEVDLREARVRWELVNSHDLGPSGTDMIGRLEVSGAYYVAQPAFLRR